MIYVLEEVLSNFRRHLPTASSRKRFREVSTKIMTPGEINIGNEAWLSNGASMYICDYHSHSSALSAKRHRYQLLKHVREKTALTIL